MKTLNLSLIAALAAAIPAFAQDTPPQTGDGTFQPKVYGREKYDKLRAKSPFEFEIPKSEAPPAVDPFEGISLTGFVGTDPQKATVYLVNEKDKTSITVWGNASPRKKTDKSEMTIIAINPGKRRADATVEIERNGQRKTLGYKEGFLSSIKAGPVGGAQPGQPGKPAMGANGLPIPGTNVNPQLKGMQPAGLGGNRLPAQGSGAVISGGGNGMNPAFQANPALNGGGGNVTISGGGGGGNMAQPQPQVQVGQPIISQPPQVNTDAAGAVINGQVPPAANTAPAINLTQPAANGMAPGTTGNPAQPVRRRVVLPTPLPAPATPAQ